MVVRNPALGAGISQGNKGAGQAAGKSRTANVSPHCPAAAPKFVWMRAGRDVCCGKVALCDCQKGRSWTHGRQNCLGAPVSLVPIRLAQARA